MQINSIHNMLHYSLYSCIHVSAWKIHERALSQMHFTKWCSHIEITSRKTERDHRICERKTQYILRYSINQALHWNFNNLTAWFSRFCKTFVVKQPKIYANIVWDIILDFDSNDTQVFSNKNWKIKTFECNSHFPNLKNLFIWTEKLNPDQNLLVVIFPYPQSFACSKKNWFTCKNNSDLAFLSRRIWSLLALVTKT